jgi:hypothetical protein
MRKIEILKRWKKVILKLEKDTQRVKVNFELDSESALLSTMHKIKGEYTQITSIAVGDENDWLEWYDCETDMGKDGRKVMLKDGTMYAVKTLDQLLFAMEQDKDEA